MTLTLELAPEVEREIKQQAQRHGLSVGEYVAAALREKCEVPARRVATGYGRFAGRGRTVDAFMADRHAEADVEMEQAAARTQIRTEYNDRS